MAISGKQIFEPSEIYGIQLPEDFRVDTKPSRFTSFAPRQVSAQLLRSLASSGLELSICAARCLRKRKFLPSHFGRLTPPPAALPHGPLAAVARSPRALHALAMTGEGKCLQTPLSQLR